MTNRSEFPARVKREVFERAGGICERDDCDNEGREYDHIVECWEGGTNEASNCMLLCPPCHKKKSAHSTHLRAKGKRFAVQKGRERSGKIKSRGFQKGAKTKWPKRKIPNRKGKKWDS